MSRFCLIEAVEMEGFGGGGVIAPAFRDVQVAGVLDGRDDGGVDGGQVGAPRRRIRFTRCLVTRYSRPGRE
jgi:hypothetical protein